MTSLLITVLPWIVGPLVVLWMCRPSEIERRGRNAWVGIRLPSTVESDEAWVAGHRAAWPAVRGGCVAAAVLGLGGLGLAVAVPASEDAVGALVIAVMVVWLVPLTVGTYRAAKAATAVTEAARAEAPPQGQSRP